MPCRALIVLCLLAGCATPQGGSARAPPSDATVKVRRMDGREARARELPELPRQEVEFPGRGLRGRVEAAGPLRYQHDGDTTTVSVPLGTDSELLCFLYDAPLDAAGALVSVARSVSADETLKVERMRLTDVEEVGGVPTLFLVVDYRTRNRQPSAVGMMKLMVRSAGAVPLLCAHDELGYMESFKRITNSLALSFGPGEPPRIPERFSDIHVMRVNRMPVGFSWRRVADTESGLRVVETTHSVLMPQAGGALRAEDSTQLSVSDREGEVLKVSYAEAHDGALALQLEASRARPGLYQFVLSHEGKQLEGTFRARRGLTSELGLVPRLRTQVLGGGEARLEVDVYQPSLDPMGPVEAVYERRADAGREVTLKLGNRTLRGTLDAQGLMERSETEATQLTSERIFLQGTL